MVVKTLLSYFKVFSQGNYSSSLVNAIGRDTNSYINAIVVFLIGLGLSKDLDPNIPLSKSEYELQMSNVICFAGMVVKQAIPRRNSNSITKCLVDYSNLANVALVTPKPTKALSLLTNLCMTNT